MKYVIALLTLVTSSVYADSVTLTKDNTISLNAPFYGETVSNLTKQAKDLDARIPSKDPIYLVLSTPGGSIDDGLELIENLSSLQRPVHTVTLFAASMGFQTVQGLGDRLIVKNGTLMSHKAKGFFYGEFPGQLDSRYGYYLKRVKRMDKQAVSRTKGKHTEVSYASLVENEYWCDGADCIAEGFADKIITASCDKSLEGTHVIALWQEIFMGHTIELKGELDNCPLNTNILKYIILIDNEPLFKEQLQAKHEEKKNSTTVDPFAALNAYYYGYSTSMNTSLKDKLSKEEMFEINQKIQKKIQSIETREVIKGY